MGIRTPGPIEPRARTKRVITDELTVIVDTREQRPYSYPGAIRGTLTTGDYSVAGFEDRVAVERKSFDDLFNTLGRGRDRFRRECERLSEFDYAAIVIESDVEAILAGHPISKMSPAAVLNTLFKWSIRFGIAVWFTGDRESGQAATYRILQHFVNIAREDEVIPGVICRRCNRPLRTPATSQAGVGPVCRVREIAEGVVPSGEIIA